jgi:ArsR family metal-binding transcriptional regulator
MEDGRDSNFMHLIFKGELVDDYALEIVHRSPCQADPARFKIIATVGRPLGEVLPIIFLSQPNSKYTRDESASYTFQRHNILIGHDGSVAVTYIKDDEEMDALTSRVIRTINKAIVYNLTHRAPLDDLVEKKKGLSPMTLYGHFKRLPEMDCGECGERSCFGFAAKLYNGERNARDCPHVDAAEIERELMPIKL